MYKTMHIDNMRPYHWSKYCLINNHYLHDPYMLEISNNYHFVNWKIIDNWSFFEDPEEWITTERTAAVQPSSNDPTQSLHPFMSLDSMDLSTIVEEIH